MEEIFVTKSQIFGARVFLGTRWVWGPAGRTQAKVPLKGFLHARKASPAGLPGATDPGLLHHLERSGSLLSPSSKDSGSTAPRPAGSSSQGWELQEPAGGEEAGYPGKGESWNLSCQAIKPNSMVSLSKPPF